MTKRQSEIAAESYAASLLAQAGYDVLVQYGANQPHYDLAAVKDDRILLVSVKGNQDGGWPLAVGDKAKCPTYHQAIDAWAGRQRDGVVFIFVQFKGVPIGQAPRAYVARLPEVVIQMKLQCGNLGHAALLENHHHKKADRIDKLPATWVFSQARIDTV